MTQNNNEIALSPWWPFDGQRVRRVPRLGGRAHDGVDCSVLKVCTLNVGSLKGRSREVVEMLSWRGVDICCLQEMRHRCAGATSIGTIHK